MANLLTYRSTGLPLLTVCLVATVLAGCTAEVTPGEPVTITFTFPESGDRNLYQSLADAFQDSHPNIKINLRPDPIGRWTRDEQNEVDAFVWWPNTLLTEGDVPLVLSLDSPLAQTPDLPLDDFYPRSLDMFRWEGSLWALPAEVDLQLLYYNKELCDEGEVAYPQAGWTWDELLWTAQRLTTVEGEPWNYTGHHGLASNPTWGDIVPFVYQHGGELFQFDDPLTEEAIQWCADLALVHGVMPRPKDVPLGDTYSLFQGEKSAMWIGFLGDRNGQGFHHLAAPWEFDWGVVPLPGDRTEATLYKGQGYYTTSRTAHVEEAWAWIRYLSDHAVGRALPARRPVAESLNFRELVGGEVATAALYAIEHLIPRTTAAGESPETLETYARTVESAVSDGERTGAYEPPATTERFTSLVESVVNGELTATEAMTSLRGE
ncbi:MAG: extracellular solute-binding protein [Chloroflexota bacterium]|nr:extracellular solute-binding protein [Chloroflexota bacterium]